MYDYTEILNAMVRFFAENDLSPQINETATEIYVHAPLAKGADGEDQEFADIFVNFGAEFYTVECALSGTERENAGKEYRYELLELIGLINQASVTGCMYADEQSRVVFRYTLGYNCAFDELIQESIGLGCYTLAKFAPAVRAVAEGKPAAKAFEECMYGRY